MAKKVGIKLDLENQEYIRKIKQSETALDRFSRKGKNLKRLATNYVGLGVAVSGVGYAIKKLVSLSEAQTRAEQKLSTVLKSTKNAAGLSAKEIKSMASSLQEVTRYGDETILEGQSLLLTFTKIGKDVFPQATETMLDMSTMMGTDLKSSAIQLGKALNDPITGISALSRVGVQLGDAQKAQIKQFMSVNDVASAQKIILQELSTQMGGQARAAADNLTGEITQLTNELGDMGEEIGGELTPGLRDLTKAIRSLSSSGVGNLLTDIFKGVALGASQYLTTASIKITEFSHSLNTFGVGWAKLKDKIFNDDTTKEKLKQAREDYQKTYDQLVNLYLKYKGVVTENESDNKTFVSDQHKNEDTAIKTKTQSMVEYYERLGQYKQAELQKEQESFQVFQQTQNYKRMTLEEQAVAEQQYRDAKLVAEYQGAQREAQMKEQVLRAKMGMESQAFKGAKMFAQAGAQLMSSQNKELFKLGQVAAIANIGINASEAIMKGWALMGPFGGSAFAALMGVVSGAQIANVLKQKPPKAMKNESADVPKPVVSAPAFAQGVIDIPSDTLAFLHQGETVMPKSFSDSVKDGDLSLGGGGTTIIVQGSIIDTDGLLAIMDQHNIDIQQRTGTAIYSRKSVY